MSSLTRRVRSAFISRVSTRLLHAVYRRFPPIVRIEPTNRCNARCVMCPQSRLSRERGTMDMDLFAKIIDECAAHRLRSLHLHNFGESLMDKTFPEKLAMVRAKGIRRFKFITNGALLKGEMLAAVLASAPMQVKISVDAADAETFEAIHRGLKYQEVHDNILTLVERKRQLGLPIRVAVAFTRMAENDGQAEAFREYWRQRVDKVAVGRVHNWGDPEDEDLGAPHACLRPWETMTILVNGDVALCCLDWDGEVILGNVREQSLAEIWQGEKLARIRRAHMNTDFSELEICRRCSKIYS